MFQFEAVDCFTKSMHMDFLIHLLCLVVSWEFDW